MEGPSWVGWVAVHGGIGWPPLVLYAAGVAWTIGYDTLYAHQDKEDDELIGVKSTARLWGDASRQWVALFYVLALAGMVAAVLL